MTVLLSAEATLLTSLISEDDRMSTVSELLDRIERLSRDDLLVLKAGVDSLVRDARSFTLTPNARNYRLTPLYDMETFDIRRRSIAIKECLPLSLLSERPVSFADAYIVLRKLCGRGSVWLDDYKQAFSFPLELRVAHNGGEISYLLEVCTCKNSLEMNFRKVVSDDDPRLKESIYYPPCEEFTADDQIGFVVHFQGFLQGYREVMDPTNIDPFVFHIPASGIVFGYCAGRSLEEQYESEERVTKALIRYRDLVTKERRIAAAAIP